MTGMNPRAELRRDLIRACVEEYPGTSMRSLSRRTGLAMGCLQHHVRILKRRGHLAEGRLGQACVFYARRVPDAATILLDREPLLQQVMAALQERGRSCQSEILDTFQALGWARTTTQYRLARLVKAGLVAESRSGRFVFYDAHQHFQHLVADAAEVVA